MSEHEFPGIDPARTRLRATMATLEREVERLGKSEGGAVSAVVADLAKQLALGPEPEVRTCPSCKRIGMRAATRCGQCWVALTPLD